MGLLGLNWHMFGSPLVTPYDRVLVVSKVRWVTRSGHPCPVCIANEAAGPRHLGEPFPSGDQATAATQSE